MQKLDFIVQQSDDIQEASAAVKTGSAVTLSWNDSGDLLKVLHDETVLGSVPKDQAQHLQGDLPSCTVRSVRKQGCKITQIMVRATFTQAKAAVPHLPGPSVTSSGQADELEGTTQLSQSQLEVVVADKSMRSMLKDQRLQEQILAIDNATDREKALQQHFLNPDFKSFTDKVLSTVTLG